ncbi:hypothetical protein PPTG_23211 [Phytophthora nicotianae INRA-310]|uniref:Uncharacterized protein n=1 Tax=Phytophthora nicotianae (strain INRA-310) TaxID=761204 RepID=W2Q400_PHYN3|nr:hypothetical protein PPTG_23211 [Phytophthora nicotianae INRA-310]ETN07601.1 hypothetical protein PPTG_23211 [Phytophthora nicotianae INRA-310]
MARNTAKGGAKAPAKAAARKAHAKSSKRHSKSSALKEATKVASEAVDASGDSTVSKRRSSRRSRSPSVSSDDHPNPRFACREHSPGSEDEAKAQCYTSVSGSSVEGHTRVLSEHSVDSVHSLAGDHVDHDSKTPERSESPANKAKARSMLAATREGNLRRTSRSPRAFNVLRLLKPQPLRPSTQRSAWLLGLPSARGRRPVIRITRCSTPRTNRRRVSSTSPGRSQLTLTSSRSCSKLLGESLGVRRRRLSARESFHQPERLLASRGELLEPTSSWRSSRLLVGLLGVTLLRALTSVP